MTCQSLARDAVGSEGNLQPKASSSPWKVSTASGNTGAVAVAMAAAAVAVSARWTSGVLSATVLESEE